MNMPRRWMVQVNEILRAHRFRQGEYFLRFQATQFPKPTVSIVVYQNGSKIIEKPIRRLSQFIEDLQEVYDILRNVRTTTRTTRTRRSSKTSRKTQTRQQRRQQRTTNSNKTEKESDEDVEIKRS